VYYRKSSQPTPFTSYTIQKMSDIKVLTGPEVAEHSSRDSCWIIVHGMSRMLGMLRLVQCPKHSIGKVYDVTDFLDGECMSA
jgi:cytochrome b involved in lipid metabolism